MNWYQNLYIGETASKNLSDIIQKIEKKQCVWTVYLIALAPDERNQLEILTPTVYERQEKRYGKSPVIVGIACGIQEARKLLVRMTQEVYQETGAVDFQSYFRAEKQN